MIFRRRQPKPIQYRTRRCWADRHLWNRDPQDARGSMFYRVDCIRCPVKLDAVTGMAMFQGAGLPFPGRPATEDEKARVVGHPDGKVC